MVEIEKFVQRNGDIKESGVPRPQRSTLCLSMKGIQGRDQCWESRWEDSEVTCMSLWGVILLGITVPPDFPGDNTRTTDWSRKTRKTRPASASVQWPRWELLVPDPTQRRYRCRKRRQSLRSGTQRARLRPNWTQAAERWSQAQRKCPDWRFSYLWQETPGGKACWWGEHSESVSEQADFSWGWREGTQMQDMGLGPK